MTWLGTLSTNSSSELDDSLDLARLVLVAALLGNRIELVKEQHTPARPRELEHLGQPCAGLTQETADDCLVANPHDRQIQRLGDGLRQTRLAIARWSGEQDAMAWLKAVSTQQLDALLLLDQLATGNANRLRQDKTLPSVRSGVMISMPGPGSNSANPEKPLVRPCPLPPFRRSAASMRSASTWCCFSRSSAISASTVRVNAASSCWPAAWTRPRMRSARATTTG